MRATSSVGPSANSNAVQATPAKPIGAPVGLTVTRDQGKVTASWSAPTDAGSYAVASYDVGIFQPGMGDPLCAATATVFTCTGDAKAGDGWQVNVTAIDTAGNRGTRSAAVAVPFSTSVPTSNGTLTQGAGASNKVVAGKTMVVSGTGYAARVDRHGSHLLLAPGSDHRRRRRRRGTSPSPSPCRPVWRPGSTPSSPPASTPSATTGSRRWP